MSWYMHLLESSGKIWVKNLVKNDQRIVWQEIGLWAPGFRYWFDYDLNPQNQFTVKGTWIAESIFIRKGLLSSNCWGYSPFGFLFEGGAASFCKENASSIRFKMVALPLKSFGLLSVLQTYIWQIWIRIFRPQITSHIAYFSFGNT